MTFDPCAPINEWLSYRDLSAGELERLGLTWEACQRAGGVAVAKVKVIGMCWEPDEAGLPHIIVPVWAGAAPSIFQAVEYPVLIDMVAFTSTTPGQWYWRTRQGYALGQGQLAAACGAAAPIILHPNPLSWLRAECAGAVLLDYPQEAAA